jgi:dTDP-4-dehydrorhamnose reductase
LVLGGSGMLGHKLCQILSADFDVSATFRTDGVQLPELYGSTRPIGGVDALAFDTVAGAVEMARPDVVVNAIGIVKQRAAALDPVPSISVNSLFPHRLAALCTASHARLIHFSTDCVFSGRRGNYTESDEPDPVDLYGRSKLLGEVAGPGMLTIRTSIIGRELENMTGLLEWFLSRAGTRVPGYAKVIWSGVTTNFTAAVVGKLARTRSDVSGVFNLSGPPLSKYELLRRLNEVFGTATTVERDETVVSDRSLNSDRFWSRTGLKQPNWDDMLSALVEDSRLYERKVNAGR